MKRRKFQKGCLIIAGATAGLPALGLGVWGIKNRDLIGARYEGFMYLHQENGSQAKIDYAKKLADRFESDPERYLEVCMELVRSSATYGHPATLTEHLEVYFVDKGMRGALLDLADAFSTAKTVRAAKQARGEMAYVSINWPGADLSENERRICTQVLERSLMLAEDPEFWKGYKRLYISDDRKLEAILRRDAYMTALSTAEVLGLPDETKMIEAKMSKLLPEKEGSSENKEPSDYEKLYLEKK